MKKQVQQLKQLLNQSQNILITAHYSPDDDAIGSALALYLILKTESPKSKKIYLNIEPPINSRFSFLPGFKNLTSLPLVSFLKKHDIDTTFMLDGNQFFRFSFDQAEELNQIIKAKQINTIAIDHHPLEQKGSGFDLYINEEDAATAQTIYNIFIKKFKFNLNRDIALNLLVALIGDTGQFKFKHPKLSEIFKLVPKLLAFDLSVEEVTEQLFRYPAITTKILAYFCNNTIVTNKGYTYSYITEKEAQECSGTMMEIGMAYHLFVTFLLRNLEDNYWGFVVVPDLNRPSYYKVSLRSSNIKGRDTSKIAVALGGGGHPPASGATFKAKDIDDAITKVTSLI